ncbi:hypothetical protein ACUOCP_56000, partial [Escherichia sp. R-CC3]
MFPSGYSHWRTIVGYSLGDVANNFAFAM